MKLLVNISWIELYRGPCLTSYSQVHNVYVLTYSMEQNPS